MEEERSRTKESAREKINNNIPIVSGRFGLVCCASIDAFINHMFRKLKDEKFFSISKRSEQISGSTTENNMNIGQRNEYALWGWSSYSIITQSTFIRIFINPVNFILVSSPVCMHLRQCNRIQTSSRDSDSAVTAYTGIQGTSEARALLYRIIGPRSKCTSHPLCESDHHGRCCTIVGPAAPCTKATAIRT